jgi:hypothetical protein
MYKIIKHIIVVDIVLPIFEAMYRAITCELNYWFFISIEAIKYIVWEIAIEAEIMGTANIAILLT